MHNVSRLETFVNCGFKHNPFKNGNFKTSDSLRIQRIVSMAIKSHALVSIVGERGVGKTRAINMALNNLKVRQVTVRSADKAKLLISDIEQAMILDLSDEKPKRGKEIRARQLRRILGEASIKNDVVVVIEEGHRLHGMTLRSLKTLREMDWMGETELFSVVLVAQSDPMMKPGVSEVRLRSDTVHLKGLTTGEISGYIRSTVGKIFTNEAIEKIAELPEARNFLNLQNMLVSFMVNMVSSGLEKVEKDAVINEFGRSQMIMDKKPVRKLKKKIGDSTEPKNSSINNVLNARQNNNNPEVKMVAAG